MIRQWQRQNHTVTALDDGFAWMGGLYKSFRRSQRRSPAPTGTAYAFFGIRRAAFGQQECRQVPKRKPPRADQPLPMIRRPPRMRRPRAFECVIRSQSQRCCDCAIYTRKSSEEGLEQDFNSLHAQRESCEAYIKSQKHEGWTALPDHL